MTPALLDHLWQSTLFAGGAGILALSLRKNPARLRFKLWFAASLKFLLPFAALSALGGNLSRLFPTNVPPLVLEMTPAVEKLSVPAQTVATHQHAAGASLMLPLAGLWLIGFFTVLGLRLIYWYRLQAVMHGARDLDIAAPVDVREGRTLLEPGLVGILKPVVLLPEGLMPRLTKAERDAILAHELSHFSSGDNITAAIHMLVEALFWFWPPVWLIGARLIAERERACDESVLADGHDAEVYAQGILKVCRFCIQSPLACASGASGADLGNRLRQIMSDEVASELGGIQKAVLMTAMATALVLPVVEGFVSTPPLMVEVREKVAAVKFQVAARFVQVAAAARQQIAAVSVEPVKVRRLPRLKIAPPAPPGSPEEQRMATVESLATPLSASAADVARPSAPVAPSASVAAQAPAMDSAAPPRVAVKDVLVALYPQGNGDPDRVTCRVPEALPGSRLPGPRICQTNREWASLRARHEDITPDGESIILPDGSEMHAGYAVLNCARERISSTGITNIIGAPASVCF
ncbi:MAG TPA: M56 family metallopeptidase [Rhizomicrobium sp.]|jgi:beta-lactamase regulating signal transducer with metallopeptidase domain